MTATLGRRALRTTGLTEEDLANPRLVVAMVGPAEPEPKRPPSSREIARRREKTEATARAAVEVKALARQVQPGLRPPHGRLFDVDAAALLLRGPAGGIGTTERVVRTLAPLTASGRHAPAVLTTAGRWQDEQALREALKALAPKLAMIGLRICSRKSGIRITKLK